jgi:tetratricopeptide (TPR) repeat protein
MARFTHTLRDAPATVPALGALALFVVWASDQAGYPVTHWAPGALIVLALLGVALWSVPLRLWEVPVAVRIALACLALYTMLSFLSILWAAVPGDAWEGANRTLLYLLVFAMFAVWPRRGSSAVVLLGAWMLAMIALAAFILLHLDTRSSLAGFFRADRLAYPAGYENASPAVWAMVMWPALLLAAPRCIPWGLRGLLAGGTVLLGDLALLSLSRGFLFATPVMLVLVFALYPGRLRAFAVLVPVAAGIGATVPAVLLVGDRIRHGGDALAALHGATVAIFAASAAVALVVALGAAIESRRTFSAASVLRVRTGVGALALATLVAVLGGGWVAAGDPLARARHAWDTFKSAKGYAANSSGNRLVSGFGSARYDFYRVALDEFAAHPLVGIGADNFQQQYLRHGRSAQTPHYPHSVELRTLAQTGIVGALLALVGLGAALVAGTRAVRAPPGGGGDPLARAVAASALAGFGYWVVHGSFDWFWEFAGLGAPAFAMLGLACALQRLPRKTPGIEEPGQASSRGSHPTPARRQLLTGRRVRAVGAVLVALAAAASLAAPWLSQLKVQSAARIWTLAPQQAYDRLDSAARLNPLSDEAYLVAGSIALRFGDLTRADHEFSLALARAPGDAYATLERGAIASTKGERDRAMSLLERAVELNPRDRLTREALLLVRGGRRVSVEDLNRSILREAQQFA